MLQGSQKITRSLAWIRIWQVIIPPWQHFALQTLAARCCRALDMTQHHCAASVLLAHVSTASAATQQPGCGAFITSCLYGPTSLTA